ncbi:MAG: RagB/SusD family nutrient uptake outer membrane protein [Tidjanibacter sp.]|nr:RagB/SusD family nutrient uptake outer membrane protein [Tidjanibacter sp.]
MKRNFMIMVVDATATLLSGCEDWLREDAPGNTKLEDFFTSGQTALQAVNAAYYPMGWEYNNTYYSEWFVGDIASDDAVKGGQNLTDMADAYDIENFKTVASNTLLLDYYRAQYQGISRCNFALTYIPTIELDETLDEATRNRYVGEAKFLRAFYYFRLVRMFGDVPLVDFVIDSSNNWKQPREKAEKVYEFILSELEEAEALLVEKSKMTPEELGRVTKGAAQALLLKVNLYCGNYAAAKGWGEAVINSGEYSLNQNYMDNFYLAGENGPESVFEIQYAEDPTSDYGEGNGFTRGTFTVILTRSRSTVLCGGNAGWGFNKPSQDLYDEYEEGDPRRDFTIINPTDAQIETPAQEIYLGSRYMSRKYALQDVDGSYIALSHATRAPINRKEIRYSDVLLMYAEACIEGGQSADLAAAKSYINMVRERVGLEGIDSATREALRNERRGELAMEGHRWFDLCRWGIAGATMNAYKAKYSAAEGAEMADFVVGKHELMPIPSEEVRLGDLTQNNGYY